MIVITAELYPFGSPEGRIVIGKGRIVNDGKGRPAREIGNYDANFSHLLEDQTTFTEPVRYHLDGYERLGRGIWHLTETILTQGIKL